MREHGAKDAAGAACNDRRAQETETRHENDRGM